MQVGIEAEPRRTLRLDQPFPDPPLVLAHEHTTELGQRLWRIVQWGSSLLQEHSNRDLPGSKGEGRRCRSSADPPGGNLMKEGQPRVGGRQGEPSLAYWT